MPPLRPFPFRKVDRAMDEHSSSDSYCPMGIVVFPALIGGLVWLCSLLVQMSH